MRHIAEVQRPQQRNTAITGRSHKANRCVEQDPNRVVVPVLDTDEAPYAQRYLDLVPKLHEGGITLGMEFAWWLFPLFGIDNAFIERAQESARHAVPGVHKTLLERSDIVRRMLQSRSQADPVS